jgi:hypothetical protein
VNILDIFVAPCQVAAPGDCEVLINGTPTSTVDTAEVASEYFRDYTLEVQFIEASHDVGNFEKPLTRNIRKVELKMNSKKLYLSSHRFS